MESNVLDSDKIFKLLQEKDRLKTELEFLMKQNSTDTQLLKEIETVAAVIKKELIIFLNFIFGLFLSIVTVFINFYLKTFKENKS